MGGRSSYTDRTHAQTFHFYMSLLNKFDFLCYPQSVTWFILTFGDFLGNIITIKKHEYDEILVCHQRLHMDSNRMMCGQIS